MSRSAMNNEKAERSGWPVGQPSRPTDTVDRSSSADARSRAIELPVSKRDADTPVFK